MKFAAAITVCVMMTAVAGRAQQPTLDQVLAKMDANFEAYRHAVPSLSADEHVKLGMSVRDDQGSRNGETTTDAVVSLRSTQVGSAALLVESRTVKMVDKKPATSDGDVAGPDAVGGVFSYARSFFSPEMKKCFDYKLEVNGKWNKQPAVVVDYTLKAGLPFDADCPVKEASQGRAYLDPVTLEIERVEQKVTHHRVAPGDYSGMLDASSGPSVHGAGAPMGGSMAGKAAAMADSSVRVSSGTYGGWTWSVDYAPVTLGGQTLWLPKSASSATSTSSGKLMSWNSVVTYSNYQMVK